MIFGGTIAFDTAENEPRKYWITDFADHSSADACFPSTLMISFYGELAGFGGLCDPRLYSGTYDYLGIVAGLPGPFRPGLQAAEQAPP